MGNIIEINLTTQERNLIIIKTFADPALIEPKVRLHHREAQN